MAAEAAREKANVQRMCERSQKLIPQTLLQRLCRDAGGGQTPIDSSKKLVVEESWIEEIEGACGLFDISGFSRLASKLTKEEASEKVEHAKSRRQSKRNSIVSFASTAENDLLKNAGQMLVEETDARGKGSEHLASFISGFFESLVETISASGGDIIKFAGDCLICVWEKKGDFSMGQTVYNAVRCGYKLKDKVTKLDDSSSLSVHICVGAGKMKLVSLSSSGRAEYFVLGDGYVEALSGIDASNSGEIVLSKGGYEHLKAALDNKVNGDGEAQESPAEISGATRMETRELEGHDHRLLVYLDKGIFADVVPLTTGVLPPPALETASSYIPRNVRQLISSGEEKSLLHDIAVVFINFRGVENMSLEQLNRLFKAIAASVNTARASLKEFIVDDKGAVAVVIVGFPGEGHAVGLQDHSNAARALSVALSIRKKAALQGVFVGTGIASGKAYCGMVGSENRCNYAAVGSIVNLSARFMGKDMKQGGRIIVNEQIAMDRYVRTKYRFAPLAPMALKGFERTVSTYIPTGRIDRNTNILNPDSTVFVSREETLEKLHDAASTDGTALLVKCEKGVGGTTCLSELVSQLEHENVLICMGSGIPKSSQYYSSYGAIAPVLQALLSIEEFKEKREIRQGKDLEADFANSETLVKRHARAMRKRSMKRITRGRSFNGGISVEVSQAIDLLYTTLPFLNIYDSGKDATNAVSGNAGSNYVHCNSISSIDSGDGATTFLLYNAAENDRVGGAVQKIVEWKTQSTQQEGIFYDRVVIVLDDLDLFDYGSLAVLNTIMNAKIPKVSIVGCVHESKVEKANDMPLRRQSVQLKRQITYQVGKKTGQAGKQESAELAYYNNWTKDEETNKRLKNVVERTEIKIRLERFSMETIRNLVVNKYGKDCKINDDVFEKLYDLGGTLPSAALDLVESWVATGALVWEVKSINGEFVSAHRSDSNSAAPRKRSGRRGSTIPKTRHHMAEHIQAILRWKAGDVADRSLDLPAQIAQYYSSVLEDLKPTERRMLELISCFPGDVLHRYIEMYDLIHDDLISKKPHHNAIRRSLSIQPKHSGGSRGKPAFDKQSSNAGRQKVRTQSQNNSERIVESLNELVANGILSSAVGKYGLYYQFLRAGMRRTTYESMLFSNRKDTHYKLLKVFKTLNREKNALHIALFHAEKAEMHWELIACLWNQGVWYQNDAHPDYASAYVSFEQALTVLAENDVGSQRFNAADLNDMFSAAYDLVTVYSRRGRTGKRTARFTPLMMEIELHKRLATISMHRGDVRTAKLYLQTLSRLHHSSFIETLTKGTRRSGLCGLTCLHISKAIDKHTPEALAASVQKWNEFLAWAKEHCHTADQKRHAERSLGEKILHLNSYFQHHIHTDETEVVAEEMGKLQKS
jgi:class 3 adenylate cyclase